MAAPVLLDHPGHLIARHAARGRLVEPSIEQAVEAVVFVAAPVAAEAPLTHPQQLRRLQRRQAPCLPVTSRRSSAGKRSPGSAMRELRSFSKASRTLMERSSSQGRSGAAGPGGLVATLLDPQGRNGNLIQCHRVSLCGHRFSPPPPYRNSKGCWCLSDVGREGGARSPHASSCRWSSHPSRAACRTGRRPG